MPPVRAADGTEFAFVGGLALFVGILDVGASPAGGRITRGTWESIDPDGIITTRCTSLRELD